MNLIECISAYIRELKQYGRIAADLFLLDVVDPEIHPHIRNCVDDAGNLIDIDGKPFDCSQLMI